MLLGCLKLWRASGWQYLKKPSGVTDGRLTSLGFGRCSLFLCHRPVHAFDCFKAGFRGFWRRTIFAEPSCPIVFREKGGHAVCLGMFGGQRANECIGGNRYHHACHPRRRHLCNLKPVIQHGDGTGRLIAQHDRVLFRHFGRNLLAFVECFHEDDAPLGIFEGIRESRLRIDGFRTSVDRIRRAPVATARIRTTSTP